MPDLGFFRDISGSFSVHAKAWILSRLHPDRILYPVGFRQRARRNGRETD